MTTATKALTHIHIPKTAGTSLRTALFPDQDETHHVPAAEIPVDQWESTFTFTFVRNPFDRVVSMYAYHVVGKYKGMMVRRYPNLKTMTFEQYVDEFIEGQTITLFLPQHVYITHPKSPKPIDFIGRFEHLADDFKALTEAVGSTAELPHQLRSKRSDYRSYYTPHTRAVVERVYERDLDEFDYEFG